MLPTIGIYYPDLVAQQLQIFLLLSTILKPIYHYNNGTTGLTN